MIPLTNAQDNTRAAVHTFLGLNRMNKGADGEWADMQNMSTREYPCLAPRMMRKKIFEASAVAAEKEDEGTAPKEHRIKAIFAPMDGGAFDAGFSGILDNDIYVNGEKIGIEMDRDKAGYAKGNYLPERITEPVSIEDGAQFKMLTFYDGIEERTEAVRVIQCTDAESAGGGIRENIKYKAENLRRGALYENVDIETEAVYKEYTVTGIEREDYDCHFITEPYPKKDSDNIESYACRVTTADGAQFYFRAGFFTLSERMESSSDRNEYITAVRTDAFDALMGTYDDLIGAVFLFYSPNHSFKMTNPTKESEKTEDGIGAKITVSTQGSQPQPCTLQTENEKKYDYSSNCYFEVGDVVEIDGFTVEIDSRMKKAKGLCINAVVKEVNEGKNLSSFSIKIGAYNQNSDDEWKYESIDTLPRKVLRKIPKMAACCLHQNRLWGAAANGEYIYASALGNYGEFYQQEGLEDDSLSFEITTDGKFIAIASFRDMIVAFKRNSMTVIYGNMRSNYSVEQTIDGIGCIDMQSIHTVGGILYFLGENGFYAYNGGQPELISQKLNCRYEKAYGFGDADRYYASAKRAEDGEYELLAYDVRYGIWTKEDALEVVGAVFYKNRLYAATSDAVYEFDAKDAEEAFCWEAVSVPQDEGTFSDKGVNELRIRAKIPPGAGIRVYTAVDGGEFLLQKELLPLPEENGATACCVYRVPVRFQNAQRYQVKLAGWGDCVIYDMERALYGGGRVWKER